MGDQELSKALQGILNKEPLATHDPRHMAAEALRTERRRFRILAALSIVFWLLAAAGLLLLLVGLNRFVIFVRISDYPAPRAAAVPASDQVIVLTDEQRQMLHGTSLLHHSIPIVAGSVVSLMLGALCTLLLVYSSRRAALRQLTAGLAEISQQLRELRSEAPSRAEPRDDGG